MGSISFFLAEWVQSLSLSLSRKGSISLGLHLWKPYTPPAHLNSLFMLSGLGPSNYYLPNE
jgi:hypothetical protein